MWLFHVTCNHIFQYEKELIMVTYVGELKEIKIEKIYTNES